MRPACAILLLTFVTGCAKYEYDLVQPSEHQRHIGRNIDQVVTIDPLEYRLRTVDNRLVMRVYNPTEDSIQLVGDKSVVVDPQGQSHPLRTQTIAPRSYIKLILPPLRPRVYDPGPHFGVGVGVGVSRYHYRRYPYYHSTYYHPYYDPWPYYPYYYDHYYDGPRYLYLEDDNDARYWDWRGVGEARVILIYQRGDDDFRHELVFRRMKM